MSVFLIWKSILLGSLSQQRFVSSPGVQNIFDRIWTSKLSDNHWLHLIAAGLTLFPILITVNFQKTKQDENDEGKPACYLYYRF